jgi:uncharacterized protein (DUF362 family)
MCCGKFSGKDKEKIIKKYMQLESTSVALLRSPNYASASLRDCFNQIINALGRPARFNGQRVLLKPNLLSAKNGPLPCTEAAFILAAARWFIDAGARVAIGDSPAFGSATANLTRLGITQELAYLGVSLSDFTRTRRCTLASGVKAEVAEDALDCDLLVNMPRIKAHAQVRVTMAVKNCFGCLTGLQKPWWHMIHGGASGRFTDLLVQLLALLPETLTLVDGIRAMHRTGPMNGEPYPLRIIAAAKNPVAVDAALLFLLNIPAECSPLQQAAMNAAITGSRVEELSFPLSSPRDLRVSDFQVPADLNPVRFRPFSFVWSTMRRTVGMLRVGDK